MNIPAGGSKWRPAVVLEVYDNGFLLVAAGTSKDHVLEGTVRVDPSTKYGRTLGLESTTHFERRGVMSVPRSLVRPRTQAAGHCPPGLLAEVVALALKA